MIFLDVHTGKPLQNVAYEGDLASMEFFEQFNEYLLIKPLNHPLRIYNVITQKSCTIADFETPEAFFFLYEKEMIICVFDGRMLVYQIGDGSLVTDFGKQEVYTKFQLPGPNSDDESQTNRQNEHYVVNLSESRTHLFTLVRQESLMAAKQAS